MAQTISKQFTTPGVYELVVPVGVKSTVRYYLWGAGGAAGGLDGNGPAGDGAAGAYDSGTMTVSVGDVIRIAVGEGGRGGSSSTGGGSGRGGRSLQGYSGGRGGNAGGRGWSGGGGGGGGATVLQIIKSAGTYTLSPNITKTLSILQQDFVDQDLVGWFEFYDYIQVDYNSILNSVSSKSWYQTLNSYGFDLTSAISDLVAGLNQTFFTRSEVFNGLETMNEEAFSSSIVNSISIPGITYNKGNKVIDDLVVSFGRIPVSYFEAVIDSELDALNLSSTYLRQLAKEMITEVFDFFLIIISSLKFKADVYNFTAVYSSSRVTDVGIVGGGGGGGGGSHNRAATSGLNSINFSNTTQGQPGQDMPGDGDGGGGGGGGGGLQGGAGGAYGPDNAYGGRGGYTGAGGQPGSKSTPAATTTQQWISPAGQGGVGTGAAGKSGLAVLTFEPLGLGKVKVDGEWVDIEQAWVKVDGDWKQITGVWTKSKVNNQPTWKEIGGSSELLLQPVKNDQYFG